MILDMGGEVHQRLLMQFKIYDPKDFPSWLPRLNALYDDLFEGGKGFRAKLVQMVFRHLSMDSSSGTNLNSKTMTLLCQTIEFIHNSSLLHDDLIDRSHLRRGKTAAWVKYSPEYAVLAGDYLLARVMVNLSSYGNIQLLQLTSQAISDLLEGEWIQDSLIRDFNVSLDRLDRVHNLKTGSLFKWCLQAPFLVNNRNDESLHRILIELGSILGLLFQRSDDLLDFDIRNYEGKAVLGDLKSGYLNSFSAFLLEGVPSIQKTNFLKCQNLDEVKVAVGDSYLQSRLLDFDKANAKLISLYDHHLKNLTQYLLEGEIAMVEELKVLPDILYWRKKAR